MPLLSFYTRVKQKWERKKKKRESLKYSRNTQLFQGDPFEAQHL